VKIKNFIGGGLLASALLLNTSCSSSSSSACHFEENTLDRYKVDQAIAKIYPALVRISVVTETAMGGRMGRQGGTGSGTIIDAEGHILTNHHVAGHGTNIVVRLSNGEEIKGKLIGTDAMTDLAIVKIDLSKRKDKSPLNFPAFGNSTEVKVGDPVLALGSPAALTQSVTLGIVSNTEMMAPSSGGLKLDGEYVGQVVRWIGHDAIIFGGNSGGPLINLKGDIVGINEVGI